MIMHVDTFWYHSEQHDSKTEIVTLTPAALFWYHSKQHDSKTGR